MNIKDKKELSMIIRRVSEIFESPQENVNICMRNNTLSVAFPFLLSNFYQTLNKTSLTKKNLIKLKNSIICDYKILKNMYFNYFKIENEDGITIIPGGKSAIEYLISNDEHMGRFEVYLLDESSLKDVELPIISTSKLIEIFQKDNSLKLLHTLECRYLKTHDTITAKSEISHSFKVSKGEVILILNSFRLKDDPRYKILFQFSDIPVIVGSENRTIEFM